MRVPVCRTFATLALASSSPLRAPNTVRSLTTTRPSIEKRPPRAKTNSPPAPRSTSSRPRSRPRPHPRPWQSSPRSPSTSTPTTETSSPAAAAAAADSSTHSAKRLSTGRFRSRSSAAPQGRSVLPYQFSRILIKLCEGGEVVRAFTELRNSPRKAQNIKVWNTLIQKCMEAEKYKLAYSVFTDMKRRGFVPNIRTYATMMSGYASIEDWGLYPKQLESVHSLYKELKQQHLENPRVAIDDSGVSFILYPIALYISILGRAGDYRKAFDVFHELDIDGPLAPHPKVYSSLLCVLADRVASKDAGPKDIAQLVSDAKYVWRRHMRSVDKHPQHYIEPRSVDAMIKVLSRGEPTDHELLFDILEDICGLPRPSEDQPSLPSPSPSPPKVAPTAWILSEALDVCITAGHPDKAVHYAESVMSSRELQPILYPRHLRKLVFAHILLAKEGSTPPARSESAAKWVEWMVGRARDEEAIPSEVSLTQVFELCYLCGDVHSALRIAHAVLEGPVRGSMSVRSWAHLLRLAIVAPPSEKRQCLELVNKHGSVLDIWESTSAVERLTPLVKKSHVTLALCIVQVLRAVPPSPDHDSSESEGLDAANLNLEQHKDKIWSDLRRRAESFLEKHK